MIVPLVTQTRAEALKELRSLSSDREWLDRTVADLTE
jgi:hypothetical protein